MSGHCYHQRCYNCGVTRITMTTVLLVDDDIELSGMLKEYLEREGFAATTVGDGESGVTEALSGRYAIVVLDVMMPGEDGLTICRDLRAQGGAHSALPILMLTARTDDADRILGLEMGADDYLGKPFVPRELLARIRAILRRARFAREFAKHPQSQHLAFLGLHLGWCVASSSQPRRRALGADLR